MLAARDDDFDVDKITTAIETCITSGTLDAERLLTILQETAPNFVEHYEIDRSDHGLKNLVASVNELKSSSQKSIPAFGSGGEHEPGAHQSFSSCSSTEFSPKNSSDLPISDFISDSVYKMVQRFGSDIELACEYKEAEDIRKPTTGTKPATGASADATVSRCWPRLPFFNRNPGGGGTAVRAFTS